MKIQNIFYTTTIYLLIIVLSCAFNLNDYFDTRVMVEFDKFQKEGGEIPSSLLMYDNIEKYSIKYKVPKYVAYNIAYLETRYQGPFDWKYKPNLTSSVGALGPMQVMPTTANDIHHKVISKIKLKNDINFNVETSMKLLQKLYEKYEDWGLVCGYYNTGHLQINEYAKFCITNKDYKNNWTDLQ